MFVYWSDGLRGGNFDRHSRNGGRGIFQQKIARRAGAFDQFFQMPRVLPGGFARGQDCLAAGIDSYITEIQAKNSVLAYFYDIYIYIYIYILYILYIYIYIYIYNRIRNNVPSRLPP